MTDFNLYSVNWQDGMLISQKHLSEQERYFENLARWYAAGAADSYGLLRKSPSGKPALGLNLSLNGDRVGVEVTRCQALTPNGTFVEITESTVPVVRAEAQAGSAKVGVYIAATDKAQTGDPDPAESVPRMPYLSAGYTLHLGEKPNLPDGACLQIAELTVNPGEVSLAEDYYPPCVNVYADDRLASRAADFRNELETLLALATRAHLAVSGEGALQGESTDLQVAFKETLHQLIYHLSSTLDTFVVGRNASHPSQMVIHFKSLFRVLTASLNLHPGLKDYLNEKLFVQQMKTDLRWFMGSIDSFLMSEYDHRNLGAQITSIDSIMKAFRATLEFLGQVKGEQLGPQAVATDMLTYMGKTYRMVDYSASSVEKVGELSYLVIDSPEAGGVNDCVVLLNKDLFSDAEWSAMQVRLGLNEARALGETDPVEVDIKTYGNKVALHPKDMLKVSSVNQVTLMFRGATDPEKFANLAKMDLTVYKI